jgi:hypothetical protein
MTDADGEVRGAGDSPATPRPLRRAKVFDGRREDGSPLVLRQGLTSVNEIMRIAGYLQAAPTVLFGRGLDQDAWAPGDPPCVPRTFSTDGTWIWSGAVTFYLRKYGMPLEPDLLAHIRAQDYALPEVPAEARESASRQVLGRA